MEAYRIKGWQDLYEVDEKGKPASSDTPQSKLRKGGFEYVRMRVYGRMHGRSYRNLMKHAAAVGVEYGLAAFGLFAKMLELAADQEREFRGWILDEKQQPIGVEDLADIIAVDDIEVVEKCLELLAHPKVDWVEKCEFSEVFPKVPQNSWKVAEACDTEKGKVAEPSNIGKGKSSGPSDILNETETETHTETKTEEEKIARGGSSDSDSAIVSKAELARQVFNLQVSNLKIIRSDSDKTTLRRISEHIKAGIILGKLGLDAFDMATRMLNDARFKDNPAAFFTSMCKKEFQFNTEAYARMVG